jgi:hypothetical protein
MSEVQINDDVSVQEYFEQKLPQIFAEHVQQNPPTDLEDQEFRINYHIDDKAYGLRVKNGTQLEVVPGGVEEAHLTSTLTETDWRDATLGNVVVPNPLLQYNTRKHLDKIKNYKGVFKLRLARAEGDPFNSATTFNGVDTPEVTVIAKASDYALIQQGKMNPQMAMMTGKVKFEGSLPFLMTLSSLQ